MHRNLSKGPPELRDAVVVDGVKYRIRSFDMGSQTGWRKVANLREPFGSPRKETTARVDDLYWDPLAGLWRVG